MVSRRAVVLGLVFAALCWAVAGDSWKIFLGMGFAFILVFWLSRLSKFLAVFFISYYRIKNHEPIKNLKEFAIILLNAAFSIGTPFFFVLSIASTTVSNAYFLQFTMPAWVLLAAMLFLGEKLTTKKLATLSLTLLGIYLIARPEGFAFNEGAIYALLSAFSYTGDIITARELKYYSYHTVAVYSNWMQVLIASVILFFIPSNFSLLFENPLGAAGIIALGLLLGIASDLYYLALHELEASTSAIISFLELFFASIGAFLLFGETPSGTELLGYALIMVASTFLILRRADIANFERLLHFTDRM